MLLQTNSYIVPKDKRSEHARLVQRFRQTLARLGCEHFEIYEQVGANWAGNETTGRFVQLMRFRDRRQQQAVQTAERNDPSAQALIKEFCELINFPYQQQQGLFAVGFYQGTTAMTAPLRQPPTVAPVSDATTDEDEDLLAHPVEESFGETLAETTVEGGEEPGSLTESEAELKHESFGGADATDELDLSDLSDAGATDKQS